MNNTLYKYTLYIYSVSIKLQIIVVNDIRRDLLFGTFKTPH